MTTDEMLKQIVNYKYESYGFPYCFLDYNYMTLEWCVSWRNPQKFDNGNVPCGKTPNEACVNALNFIKENPRIFTAY